MVLPSLVGCQEQLIHHLSEGEANRLITQLADVGIVSEKVKQADGSWAIAVDSADTVTALRAVSDSRLLRDLQEVPPDKGSLMSSREDQRFRYERALSRELQATLNNIPHVLESRVHLNLPMVDPLFGQKLDSSPGSASVLLVVNEDSVSRQDVAAVLAGASGIPFKDISIMVSVTKQRGVDVPRQEVPVPVGKEERAGPVSLQEQLPKREDVPWYLRHKEILFQVAASLIIVGIATALYLFRRGRKAEVFTYETQQTV